MMNIKWLKNCRITIFRWGDNTLEKADNFNQWDITAGLVNKGVNIFGSRLVNNREYVDIQFWNGNEAYDIPRDCIQEIGIGRAKAIPKKFLKKTAFKLL